MNLPQVDVSAYERDGYVLVKDVFSSEEMARLRSKSEVLKRNAVAAKHYIPDSQYPDAVFLAGDLLSKDELQACDFAIFDRRVLSCVKQILGPDIVYFGDSSIQFGEGTRGFHKDNVDRSDPNGPDWEGPYKVIRVGIYLQDHARHSGGLKVRVRSHQYVSHHDGKAVNVPSKPGDIVLWNLRTSHSGNNVRLRLFPNLCLHPRIERIIPRRLRVPEQQERIALFCAFGAPGQTLDRYIQYLTTRTDSIDHWRKSRSNEATMDLAKRREVEVRHPISDYGALSQMR